MFRPRRLSRNVLLASGLLMQCAPACAESGTHLSVVGTTDQLVWNGVAALKDGRIVVDTPRLDDKPNPSVALLGADNTLHPYPGGAWNAWKPGQDPADAFVSVNAIHVGPNGALWVVDNGAVGLVGRPMVPGSAKIVVIDTTTNGVRRVYRLGLDVLRPRSGIDDIRFNGDHAYITDAGAPGLIVLDLKTGAARRVLDHDPSTTAGRPVLVDGKILRGPDGKPAAINADQLEVTPDGKTLYFQPLPGPLYRVSTRLLDDPAVSASQLSRQVEFWYNTPSLGGTAIDADGNLYLDDLNSDAVLKLTPERKLSLVVHDPRLHWADAPAFDGQGNLLLPVPQLDRAPPFNHGRSAIVQPVMLFRLHVGAHAPEHG